MNPGTYAYPTVRREPFPVRVARGHLEPYVSGPLALDMACVHCADLKFGPGSVWGPPLGLPSASPPSFFCPDIPAGSQVVSL